MSGKALLDTNVVIAIFAGDPDAIRYVQKCSAVFLCVPVVGELRYGALASSCVKENMQRLDAFAKSLLVLNCDPGTSVCYGEVRLGLRKKGHPIPENDVWIAAIARQHGLKVVSRDSHFAGIDHLDVEIL